MANGLKIALPGYNALTDTDPSHFSLFVDGTEDHVIIKEKTRNTESVNGSSSENVAHGLSYPPLAMVYAEVSAGEFQWANGITIYSSYQTAVTATNLVLSNSDVSARTFTYIIFHDEL